MATRYAIRKKMRRQFKTGDVITWGTGAVAHSVIDVVELGVVVDSTSSGFGRRLRDGRLTLLIEFAPGSKSKRCHGPPRHSSLKPDQISRDK